MRILAIETVGTTGSVAALVDQRVLLELPLNPRQRSAQSLAPGIDELLRAVSWQPQDVELVAVAAGPGSFTGLRIGVTTAKTFAYAVGASAISVDTLEAIASRCDAPAASISVVLDAGRGELFTNEYQRLAGGELAPTGPTRIVAGREWLQTLRPGQTVTGPALEKLREQLPTGVAVADPALWQPSAAAVGRLGAAQFAQGQRESLFDVVPRYYRRTAAEEQWQRRNPR